jgi:hypothetical protein
MRASFYGIAACLVVANLHGFVVYGEQELARRAARVAAAETFMDWRLVRSGVMEAAPTLPEAKEIAGSPAPTAWQYSYMDDRAVRFVSAAWLLHLHDKAAVRSCTVYVPLKSRSDGHGYVALEFQIEVEIKKTGGEANPVAGEVMKKMACTSYRYLTDTDDDFLVLSD